MRYGPSTARSPGARTLASRDAKGDRERQAEKGSGRGADAADAGRCRPHELIHPTRSAIRHSSSPRYDQPAITSHRSESCLHPHQRRQGTLRRSKPIGPDVGQTLRHRRPPDPGRPVVPPTGTQISAVIAGGRGAPRQPTDVLEGLPDGRWLSFDEHDDGRLALLSNLRHEGAPGADLQFLLTIEQQIVVEAAPGRTTASCRAAAGLRSPPGMGGGPGSIAGAMTQQGMPGQSARSVADPRRDAGPPAAVARQARPCSRTGASEVVCVTARSHRGRPDARSVASFASCERPAFRIRTQFRPECSLDRTAPRRGLLRAPRCPTSCALTDPTADLAEAMPRPHGHHRRGGEMRRVEGRSSEDQGADRRGRGTRITTAQISR